MKKIVVVSFLFIPFAGFSQTLLISGTAFDTTKGRNRVQITLNDTLRKFREAKSRSGEDYAKLTRDTNVVLWTSAEGTFQIRGRKTDSLYFSSFRHLPKVYAVADLLKMKRINIQLEPEACVPYVPCNDAVPSKVYAFIGEKIKVDYQPELYYCDVITMDSKFSAEYKIVHRYCGNFPKDTIRFTVFDHYGRPAFSKYDNALLFVSEYCGKLYHEKYQYFDVYKTTDGKWASPGDPYKYDAYHRKNIKALVIRFAGSVWFDVSKLSEAAIQERFPSPYYRIEGKKAVPVMGTYVDDLITVKKEGVLKARKIPMN